MTIYYSSDPDRARFYRDNSDFFFEEKGLKIELARKILLHRLLFAESFVFSDYNYIWFPDDDLRFPNNDDEIEGLFEAAAFARADVFQPAICNEFTSPCWDSTKRIDDAYAHRTNIVEIMAHGFSGEVFEKAYLPAIHVMDFMKSGWGLDPIYLKIGESVFKRRLRTFVFDENSIIHTRPVGSGVSIVHQLGRYERSYVPQAYTNLMETLEILRNKENILADRDVEKPDLDLSRVDSYHSPIFDHFLGREAKPTKLQACMQSLRNALRHMSLARSHERSESVSP
jgi:hypothetical protein